MLFRLSPQRLRCWSSFWQNGAPPLPGHNRCAGGSLTPWRWWDCCPCCCGQGGSCRLPAGTPLQGYCGGLWFWGFSCCLPVWLGRCSGTACGIWNCRLRQSLGRYRCMANTFCCLYCALGQSCAEGSFCLFWALGCNWHWQSA